jgi:isopenicillin-N epimerase
VDLEPALDDARRRLATFLGADAEGLAFLPNATTAVNTVLRSLRLEPGDQLLVTDHAYNAVRNALAVVAEAAGAQVITVPLPFPGVSADAVEAAIIDAVGPRTRLAVLDHVTSATAMVLPIERLVPALQARGVAVLVDGAHAPGMLDLDLAALNADYYAGNLHKWACAPIGTGFLHVRADHLPTVRPLVISHGANSPRTDRSRFRLEFDWLGTSDPSAYLAVPTAIDFLGGLLPGGWPAVRARNHALALAGRNLLVGALGIPKPVPDDMIGTMASVPLAPETGPYVVQGVDLASDPVYFGLLREHRIQVMVTPWPQRPEPGPWRRLVRISAALHDDIEQMEALAAALPAVLAAPTA